MPRVSVPTLPRVSLSQVLRGLLVIVGLVLVILQIVWLTASRPPRVLEPPLPAPVIGGR